MSCLNESSINIIHIVVRIVNLLFDNKVLIKLPQAVLELLTSSMTTSSTWMAAVC